MSHTLALIALLPLVGFVLNGTFATALGGHRFGHRAAALIGCAAPLASFALTISAFLSLQANGYAPVVEPLYRWATVGGNSFDIAFYFDRLSAIMTLIVTGVGSVIHIYSTGYMHDDKSFGRFFAYLNLFLFFMLLLVLGRSMLVLFVGWEGVGLASYLLIGFWFDDLANAAAGRKAFITNRIGDAGFLLGMFLLYRAFGTLDMDTINGALVAGQGAMISASLVALLLFVGATGKSAQIPLYVWLPDAMAGPTPVSALIHAATMVTAGVYLVARMSAVYVLAPDASQVMAVIGVLTAFFAATIALVQTDIKKVLAYSTVSQLGFMFLALGVGAYGVAIFHVMTHAFFKACLFLGAGSVIHALGGEQDIRKMGGLRKRIPVTFWTFAIATAAIAGIPGLAGFFSKDEILWYAFSSASGGAAWMWGLAALTALMTAFYMTRLLWLTFFGASRMSHEVEHHVHESPLSMTGVLGVLAVLSVVGGYIGVPHFLEPQLPLPQVVPALEHYEHTLLYVSVALAFGGVGLAVFLYSGPASRPESIARTFAPLHALLSGKYFVDELYDRALGRPLVWISENVLLKGGDRMLLDGTLNGLGAMAHRTAALFARVQTGSLHLYGLMVVVGLVGVVLWSWRHV
ncbi:MAG TPA: NADH-quinone oxidoreductase subunit L [Gemmatimonas aurantiaca]|uniref:NADH-quinone oxidoreductase chain L n=2 Tax=Gemmatimonas aurantiaca TaxID=173480 RepID=C1AB28_GEMAT|nr:NADH-quinone oxidoreductase subunit L [Gemmatimonas aurantiaca]BAH39434.1 NADH-quinone oxidoreductase chain L [Gemmatimonas aurantiaca T-27]HCT56063.1 NADH-quinone oxidoreductase subunit L [Gemmatimonas aurantiaca]